MAYQPLLTEDTGTQGAGKRQIEVSVDATRDRASASRSTQTNLIATYGLTPKVDVQDLDLDLGWRRGVNSTASERTLGAGITMRW